MPNSLLPNISSSGRLYQDEIQIWLHWVMLVALLLVTGVIVLFVVKYRKTDANPKATSNLTDSHFLEWFWTLIPTAIFFYMFYVGIVVFLDSQAEAGVKYVEVDVTASQWQWKFEYPQMGIDPTTNELFLEAGKSYKMNMTTPKTDVLHSFYMRSAGVKADIIPGKTNYVVFDTNLEHFTANDRAVGEKTVDIFCTEYCGNDHSAMLAVVHIMMPGVFKKWVSDQKKQKEFLKTATKEERGAATFKGNCASCHSVSADKAIVNGPAFAGLFGKSEVLEDGSSVVVNEDYVRESIINPGAKIVKGFSNIMPTQFKDTLKPEQIEELIAYIRSKK